MQKCLELLGIDVPLRVGSAHLPLKNRPWTGTNFPLAWQAKSRPQEVVRCTTLATA